MARRSCVAWTSCVCGSFVAFVILFIVFGVVLCPSDVTFSIETATLTHVVNANRNTVDVNITVDVNLRNPSRRQGVYYKYAEADAYYKGTRLRGSGAMPPFRVGPKNNTVLSVAFWGESCYGCGDHGRLDDSTGWFDVDMWICPYFYEYKVGSLTLSEYSSIKRCQFTLRLGANKTTKTEFNSNPCYQPNLGKYDTSGCQS